MNQSQHDELSRLFAQSMQLQQQAQQVRTPLTAHNVPYNGSEKLGTQAAQFTSSHYTGTAHLRPDTTSEPSRSPPPPYYEALMPDAMAELLRQHTIDPSSLLPNQIHLFLNADNEQRTRLLELWRIAPPSYPLEQHLTSGTSNPTTVAREEYLAKVRYEQQALAHNGGHEEHMLDTHLPVSSSGDSSEPISPIREAGEAAWPPAARFRASTISANSRPETRYGEPEPYMLNGYAANTSAKSIDPVYAAAAGLWQAPSYAQAVEDQGALADQYGMYEQLRDQEEWQRLSERRAGERMSMGAWNVPNIVHNDDDDDMEL